MPKQERKSGSKSKKTSPKKIKLNKKKLENLFRDLGGEIDDKENTKESNEKKSLKKINEDFGFEGSVEVEDSTPALERIARAQSGPVFVPLASRQAEVSGGSESSSDSFKYTAGGANGNGEPKYLSSPEHMTANVERADFNRIGRDFSPGLNPANQEAMFMESFEPKVDSPMQERRWEVERRDFERERRNPLENDDTKYKKYEPDLPKSR